MRARSDLDALDRATLLTWRATNLVGWWAAGAATYVLPQVVFVTASNALRGRISAVIAAPLLVLVPIMLLVVVPALAGRMVGWHVYGWPGWTAGLAIALPVLTWVATTSRSGGANRDSMIVAAAAGISGILVAAASGRAAWLERPRALRAGPRR